MKYFVFSLLLIIPALSVAQACDCASNFAWAQKTFEENDAGFAFVVDAKGKQAYEAHNQLFERKVENISELADCAQTIYEWLTFFRSGHIGIQILGGQQNQASGPPNNEKIMAQFANWEKLDVEVPAFTEYLETKDEHDFEGVWASRKF